MNQTQDLPETTLMRQLAGGDDLALNEIMDRWSPRLISFLQRLTGDAHAAHDLAQETFVRIYRHRTTYQPSQAFSTWLFHIATNLARNHARWRSRHPETLVGRGTAEDLPGSVSTDTPADSAMRWEQSCAVKSAVRGLPEDLREALILSVYEGLPHAEIAVILGLSTKGVEMRIYRARQALRQQLEQYMPSAH